MFYESYAVKLAKIRKLVPQRPMRYLYEVLIVPLSNVDIPLPLWVITAHNSPNSVFYAISDNAGCGDTHAVVDATIPFAQVEILSLSESTLVPLQVIDGLKSRVFLVIQTIVRFELFPIEYERCPIVSNTSGEVV